MNDTRRYPIFYRGDLTAIAGAGAVLTFFGIVHQPAVGIHPDTIFWGYVMMTALFILGGKADLKKESAIGELDFSS